jgi:hypothetical protein
MEVALSKTMLIAAAFVLGAGPALAEGGCDWMYSASLPKSSEIPVAMSVIPTVPAASEIAGVADVDETLIGIAAY